MQAPSTPSGPPAPQPGGRACPSCGASNGPLAAFCWQCYRQFGGSPASASSPGGLPRAPGTYVSPTPVGLRGTVFGQSSEPTPVPTATRRGKLGAVWMALAVVGGYLLVQAYLGRAPDVALPATLGPLPRVENTMLDQASQAFRDQSDGLGVDTDMGFYGTSGTPSAALMWVDGSDVFTSTDAWSEFTDGINTGAGLASVDRSRTTVRTVGDVEYTCAPLEGDAPGNVCMWQAEDVYWVLFDLSQAAALGGSTLDLAVAAHDAPA